MGNSAKRKPSRRSRGRLPYCDAMFMDNGCRSLLLDVPTALRPPETAKVFSLNVKAQSLDYLRSIRDGISAEHVRAI